MRNVFLGFALIVALEWCLRLEQQFRTLFFDRIRINGDLFLLGNLLPVRSREEERGI